MTEGAINTSTADSSTRVMLIRRLSVSTEMTRGFGSPRASTRTPIEPIIVADITERTSIGAAFLVHTARTVPVRFSNKAASIGPFGLMPGSVNEVRLVPLAVALTLPPRVLHGFSGKKADGVRGRNENAEPPFRKGCKSSSLPRMPGGTHFKAALLPETGQRGPEMGGRGGVRIEERNGLDPVRALAPAWNELEHRSRTRVPALHPDYVALWMERLGRESKPRVLAAWEGDRLVGYAPFMETVDPFGPFSVRALKFIGNNVGFPGDILYADILAVRNHGLVARAILQHAKTAWKMPKWDFGFLSASSPTPAIAAEALTLGKTAVDSLTSQSFVDIELPESREQFLSLHPRAKGNFRRRLAKLEKLGDAHISAEEGPEQVRRRMAEMLRSHAKSWGTTFKRDWFGDAAVQGFLVEAAHLLASQGRYIAFTMELNGEPISWTSGALLGNQYTGYQRSYIRTSGPWSPGTLLDLFVVRHLLTKGVCRLRLGPGLGDHKQVLGAVTSEYVHVRGYRGWRRYAERVARRWKKSSRSYEVLGE